MKKFVGLGLVLCALASVGCASHTAVSGSFWIGDSQVKHDGEEEGWWFVNAKTTSLVIDTKVDPIEGVSVVSGRIIEVFEGFLAP